MNDLFSLKDKRILLTGAAGFFGTYFSEAFLKAGAGKVYLIDIDQDKLNSLKRDLEKKYDKKRLNFLILDQYNLVETEKVFKSILKEGVIDVLVNNSFEFGEKTGFNSLEGRIEKTTFEQMERAFNSGIYWPLQATQIFANGMIDSNKGGSIINLGSMYSVVAPNPSLYEGKDYLNPPGYSISKAGVLALTRYSASFYGSKNIRVNSISPGAIPNIETVSENSEQNKDDVFMQRLIDRTLLKRVGHPNDLIGAMVFLASDASSYITGQNIIIDGGWVIT